MKFGTKLIKLMVPEWSNNYLNYKALKTLLSPFKVMCKYYIREAVNIDNFVIENCKEELDQLPDFNHQFEILLLVELEKISNFYHERLKDLIKKWRLLKINAIIIKNAKARVDYEEKKSILKVSFQIFYKQIRLLNEYISLNIEAFYKILKKHRKFTKNFINAEEVKTKFEAKLRTRHLTDHQEYLANFVAHTEQDYLEIFYMRKDRKFGQLELRKIYQGKLMNQTESFFFGFFFGLTIACMFLTMTLFWIGSLNIEDDPEFKGIFPIFRGIGLFIIYSWLLGFNVYGWTSFNINYKLIFNFSYHYSSVVEILNRAAFFTATFVIMFLWFIILRQEIGDLAVYINFIPMNYSALVVWIIFLGYYFVPFGEYFNPQGRQYLFKLIRDIIASVIFRSSFRVTWATDQLLSFVIPLKDLEYTFCYYTTAADNREDCQNNDRYVGALIVAVIPMALRFLQIFDNSNFKHIFIMNGIKYLLSIITVLFSYAYVITEEEGYYTLWVVMFVILVPFTIGWDLKMDWGFFNQESKHRFLRSNLAYPDLKIYYVAIVIDVILRFFWMFSISPGILKHAEVSETLIFCLGASEIFRRSIWNFLRVEREHLFNVGTFKATDDLTFPYPHIKIDPNGETSLFQNELAALIHEEEHQDDNVIDPKIVSHKDESKIKSEEKRQALRNILTQRHVSIVEEQAPLLQDILKQVKIFKEKIQQQVSSFSIDPMQDNFNKSTMNLSQEK